MQYRVAKPKQSHSRVQNPHPSLLLLLPLLEVWRNASRSNRHYLRNAERELKVRLEHPKMFIWIHSFSHIFVLRKHPNTSLWFPRHCMNGPGLLSGSSHCIASYTGPEHTGPQEGQKYAMLSPSSRPVCGGFPPAQMSFLDSAWLVPSQVSA